MTTPSNAVLDSSANFASLRAPRFVPESVLVIRSDVVGRYLAVVDARCVNLIEIWAIASVCPPNPCVSRFPSPAMPPVTFHAVRDSPVSIERWQVPIFVPARAVRKVEGVEKKFLAAEVVSARSITLLVIECAFRHRREGIAVVERMIDFV